MCVSIYEPQSIVWAGNKIKNQVRRQFKQESACKQTDGWTDVTNVIISLLR